MKHHTVTASNNTPPGGTHPPNLPFTGFDLGLPVMVAILAIGSGWLLRRRTPLA